MRLLRDLNNEERLALYKKALPIWIEHPGDSTYNTHIGLCNFFHYEGVDSYNDLKEEQINSHLKEWHRHVTSKFKNSLRINGGNNTLVRIKVLKAMINDLERAIASDKIWKMYESTERENLIEKIDEVFGEEDSERYEKMTDSELYSELVGKIHHIWFDLYKIKYN